MVSDIIERVEYSLAVNGTISNWLAHGPDLSPIHNLPDVVPSEGATFGAGRRWVLNYWAYHPESIRLKTRLYQDLKPFDWQPTTQPILDVPFQKGRWNYRAVGEDGVVDFSHFNFSPALMRAWTYAQLTVDTVQSVQAEIQTIGPCQAWLNGACVFTYDETFRYVHPLKLTTTLSLQAGPNDLYLHGLMLGWREARLVLGMRLLDSPAIRVRLPLGDIPVRDWQQAENDLAQIHIKQFAFPQLPITLELSPTAPNPVTMEAEIQTDILGRPWKDTPDLEIPTCVTTLSLAPGETGSIPVPDDMLKAITTLPGEQTLHLILHSDAARQYERQQEVWVTGNRFSHAPYGDYESRRQEALEHLARIPCDVMGTLAAVALGQQEYLDSLAIEIALDFLQRRFDCADFYAVSLLMLLYRYGGSEHLKEADREKITATFRDFKYWIDEPGLDAMCYFTENHQILFHVTALLAGQYWPDSVFTNSGLTGRQQQQRAHRRIQNWILRRLQGGYSEWDSNSYMTLDVFAMLALAEHAQSARLREMATALLHKTFFMLAVQSYRGTHGSTHGRCYVTGLKSARVENSSGIQRIAWGMGIFNGETRATGLLALAQNYRVPSVIQKIGADISRDLVTCAHSSGRLRRHFDMVNEDWSVRTLTRRTADYMLSATLDYRPGERGIQEHLWQATLSSEAVVFTNYPGNSQEHGNARPNFWAGSARLPRVAMHEKTVLCLYPIDSNTGLGWNHAYFPTAMFDEWRITGQWAFARLGQGIIALWGDGELSLTQTGQHIAQELRSANGGEAWLCTVGSEAEDGDFAAYCQRLQQTSPTYQDGILQWQMPQGERLSLDWQQPFTINGQAETWVDYPHYDNAYTHTPPRATQMTIEFGDESLTLDLEKGRID